MKRLILLLTVLIGLNGYSQTKYKTTATNYFNNILWSQIFNNFDVKIPITVISPWVMIFGSIHYIDNDFFVKNNFIEDDIFAKKDIILKEFTKTLNVSFLNYIPTDSTLLLNALSKDRLLYTINLQKSDSVVTTDYQLPDNETGEKVIFDKSGNLISCLKYKPGNRILTTTTSKLDSVIIRKTTNGLKSYIVFDESRYSNEILTSEKIFKEEIYTKKRKFVSNNCFQYNAIGSLSKVLTLNKKGVAIDSIEYFYWDDTLTIIKQNRFQQTPNLIFCKYSNGYISQKEIMKNKFSVQINYEYDKDKISRITYFNKSKGTKEKYEFGYDIGGALISVLCKSLNKYLPSYELKRQLLFTYNDKNNIKTIKVVNKNGFIEKEINYEYDFK
ncbi:MAG: hypothetical protein NT175_02900 [Bacteroidetes bacterium]|nr:hypothetical protein [Bacteroidota bacterium]